MDKKALPEYNDLDYGHIRFEWKIASFLTVSSDESVFKEEINCNAFKSLNDIESYWSFPELLLDARWLQESVLDKRTHVTLPTKQDTLTNDTDFQFPYLKSEFQLYRIVTTISTWAWNVERYFKKMLEEESKEHLFPLEDGLIKIATEYATLSTELPYNNYDDDKVRQILSFAKSISESKLFDDRASGLKKDAREILHSAKQTFGKDLNLPSSLAIPVFDNMPDFLNKCSLFCKKLLDVSQNKLWRTTSSYRRKLDEFRAKFEKILFSYHRDVDETNPKSFHMFFRDSIQTICKQVVDRICSRGSDLFDNINKAMQDLNLSSSPNKCFSKYLKDANGKCVALLDMDKGKKLLAFSGFYDCEGTLATSHIANPLASNMLDGFRKIAQTLNATLVTLNESVADNLFRYEPDSCLQIAPHGPLSHELLAVPPQKFQKNLYSCCERKILAYIEANSCTCCEAFLVVKFSPCLSCFEALCRWKEQKKISLNIYFPRLLIS